MKYVLVHGLGLSFTIWSRLIPLLEGCGEVIAVDLPGHGMSTSTQYSWDGIWVAVSGVVDDEEWLETTLVLHSFTASLLLEIIAAKVMPLKIILVEGIMHSADIYWSNDLATYNDVQFEDWLTRFRNVTEMSLKSQLVLRHSKSNIQKWSESFKIVKGDALRTMAINLKERLNSGDIPDAFNLINTPIFYIRGKRSRLREQRCRLIENYLNVDCYELLNSGHFPMIDEPDELAALIVANI